MAVAIAATAQTAWPPRVLVQVTGLTIGNSITVYRSVGGERTALRGGTSTSVTDTSFLVLDAELPFGIPVTYVARVNAATDYATSATAYALPGGKVALSDAISGLSAEAVILAWDSSTFQRQATVFKVGARNVVVAGALGQPEQDITLYAETDTASALLLALFTDATSAIVQIRQPGGYADVDGYYAITSAERGRFSQDGTDPRRTWTVRAVSVDGWPSALQAAGFTLQDIYDYYGASGTLADLAADYPTLLSVAQADWS